MALVKVRNLNDYPFSQKYQDKMITIPVGGFVEMDEEEASVFVGMFFPFKRDNKGNDDPKFFKKLKIERDAGIAASPVASKFMCNACKEQTSSWVELEAHTRLMHSDLETFSDPNLDKELAQKAKERGAKATAGASPG